MTEDSEQMAIMTWARWQSWGDGKLADYLHHSPNGGKRHIKTAQKFKAMGTQAGFPDLFLFIPHGGYHGLFIELKRPKSQGKAQGRLSDSQKAMMAKLGDQGYRAVVCYGYDEAIQTIRDYLGIDE